ncbi:MAG: dihydroneopterin aldolase [Candidatus Omnitrophica bacterium]|nr:dihydroneopterin aldolase [Candidatus Omnitrophota bacterium]MBU1997462.1 dihydroneopterin aldolase [Candidatus Omnitrophota bacterium]MBU4332988.1 dihydroneopterin aldolase [Candidatus Omnitrophota bacterium]
MTTISIKNLKLKAIIGTNSYEREEKQDIIINIDFCYDDSLASQSDDLSDAVNYKEIEDKVKAFCESSKFYLLEKLSRSLIDIVMENPFIIETTVYIEKPNALDHSDSVSIKKTKKRD